MAIAIKYFPLAIKKCSLLAWICELMAKLATTKFQLCRARVVVQYFTISKNHNNVVQSIVG